jgi:unsaturated rhamnogalacturonyl hydrolase
MSYCAAYTGILALAGQTRDERYYDFVRGVGKDLGWQTGARRYFADDYCIGQVYAELYLHDRDPAMLVPLRQLAGEIAAPARRIAVAEEPRHHDREWAWCDAMFMGPTTLAYLASATGERKYLDLADRLWWKTAEFLYDRQEHLYFRDESYFQRTEKNGQKTFWSRGTGFYTYAILWGLNNGLLDDATYWPIVNRAWGALDGSVHPDGKLGYVQPVGAAPDHVDADTTETYGPGAFLLAGTQLVKYLETHPQRLAAND